MDIVRLDIPEVLLLRPARFADARGYFTELASVHALTAAGVRQAFVQDNLSYSARAGTVRGLHYQSPPRAQAKLVAVITGAIRDVAVDVRRGSPTFGRHVTADLSADDGRQIYVPPGFLHGFITLQPDTRVLYKVDNVYAADCDGAVRWDDPALDIDWGETAASPVLSDKDAAAPAFSTWSTPFVFETAL